VESQCVVEQSILGRNEKKQLEIKDKLTSNIYDKKTHQPP